MSGKITKNSADEDLKVIIIISILDWFMILFLKFCQLILGHLDIFN